MPGLKHAEQSDYELRHTKTGKKNMITDADSNFKSIFVKVLNQPSYRNHIRERLNSELRNDFKNPADAIEQFYLEEKKHQRRLMDKTHSDIMRDTAMASTQGDKFGVKTLNLEFNAPESKPEVGM